MWVRCSNGRPDFKKLSPHCLLPMRSTTGLLVSESIIEARPCSRQCNLSRWYCRAPEGRCLPSRDGFVPSMATGGGAKVMTCPDGRLSARPAAVFPPQRSADRARALKPEQALLLARGIADVRSDARQ